MLKIKDILAKRNIPTDSHIKAVGYCNKADFSHEIQTEILTAAVPTYDVTIHEDLVHAKYSFLYFVQDAVMALNTGRVVDAETLLLESVTKSNRIISQLEWLYDKEWRDEEFKASQPLPKSKQEGLVQNKGTKMEKAILIYKENKQLTVKEIAALFVGQLDMTPAGATSYAYILRKKAA